MTALNKQALIAKIKKQTESFDTVVLKEDEALALVEALEAAENRIAELEAREVVIPSFPESTDWFLRMNMQAVRKMTIEAIRAAGIGVKGE